MQHSALGSGAMYCDEHVCLSVCLSARVTRKSHNRTSPSFMHVAVPVLWMTSCFYTMRSMVQSQGVRQVAVLAGRQTTTAFGRVHQNAVLGSKSAVHD